MADKKNNAGDQQIKSVYLREQYWYRQDELFSILTYGSTNNHNVTENEKKQIIKVIRDLRSFNLLKVTKGDEPKDMSELQDENVIYGDFDVNNKNGYVFTYVGIIAVDGYILKIYPKYLPAEGKPKDELQDELRKVLKVIEKYNRHKQVVKMFEDFNDDKSFDLLAVMLYLLQDYYENGLYTNTERVNEINGTGEILWDKTVNETYPLISDKRPYYTDLWTRRRVNNEYDYFNRLHKCVLTKISRELKSADLLDIFGFVEADLSDEELDDFGNTDYILYRIEKELNTQFNTRKQQVLCALHTYISHDKSLNDIDCLSLFGTGSFNLVWEKICAEILDNQLDTKLCDLKLPNEIRIPENHTKNVTLQDLIEKPKWNGKTSGHTLIPDIITVKNGKFYIFDAKYYNADLTSENAPSGQPGVESVTKQYLYQLAYKDFLNNLEVYNCFLFPTCGDKIIDNVGEAQMNMLNSLGLENIQIRFLPADMVYDLYLTDAKIDISDLNLTNPVI